MSKCEEFGYLIGDLFWVMEAGIFQDSVARLIEDNGTYQPKFQIVNGKHSGAKIYFALQNVALVREDEKPEILGGSFDQDLDQDLDQDFDQDFDPVDRPSHYASGDIECIDAMRAQMTKEEFEGHMKGNVIKYMWRWREKGGVESLKKAKWYLNKLIEEAE